MSAPGSPSPTRFLITKDNFILAPAILDASVINIPLRIETPNFTPYQPGIGQSDKELCDRICKQFQTCPVNLELHLQFGQFGALYFGDFQPEVPLECSIRIKDHSTFTQVLIDQFGENNVKMQVKVSELEPPSGPGNAAQFERVCSNEMTVYNGREFACEDRKENAEITSFFNNIMLIRLSGVSRIKMYVTLIITVTPGHGFSGALKLYTRPTQEDKMAIYKRMLEEEIGSDVIIIASNGTCVKCHKSFLSVHSEVFRAMFQTDMQESKTHTVEMPDMSEAGIRAFLAYLYYWDESQAEESSLVALELLKAGHKYGIMFLEEAMKELMAAKEEEWYSVEVAMKMFLFARNLPEDWEPLKFKAIKVLKRNFSGLRESTTFKELFKDNPDAAMDLCQYSFAV